MSQLASQSQEEDQQSNPYMSVTRERSPGSTTASSSEDGQHRMATRQDNTITRRTRRTVGGAPQEESHRDPSTGGQSYRDEGACDDSDGSSVIQDDTCIHPLSPPFELTTRGFSTEWMIDDGRHKGDKLYPLLLTYLSCILLGQLWMMWILPFGVSWTVTNVLHGFVTMLYLHWIKGSPDFLEPGGETNGMTLWEQLAATSTSSPVVSPPRVHRETTAASTPGTSASTASASASSTSQRRSRSTSPCTTTTTTTTLLRTQDTDGKFANQRLVLLVVPTLLCHAACHFASYDKRCCLINVSVWTACVVAKMPFMYGVRLLGINRTAGIDDEVIRIRRRRH